MALGGGVVAAGAAGAAGWNAFGVQSAGAAEAATASSAVSGGQCVLTSSATEGPYYLDGALVRKDITEGKKGIPLSLNITVQDTTDSCNPVKGAAVEIWRPPPHLPPPPNRCVARTRRWHEPRRTRSSPRPN